MTRFYPAQTFLTLLIFCIASVSLQGQTVFWQEDFNNGCNTYCLANTYAGPNGTWSVTGVGPQGNVANEWFISCAENGEGAGQCGAGCGNDATLHVGNVPCTLCILCPAGDCGAAYNAGPTFFGENPTTNKRAESPVIDCSAYSTIFISFKYIGDGQTCATDYCDLVYSANGGGTWSNLQTCLTAPTCAGGQGLWTVFNAALPATADNNPNVKIGFRWANNADGNGNDPSWAVDSVVLYVLTISPPVADFVASSTNICEGQCIDFTDLSTGVPISWQWSFPGAVPATSGIQNPTGICYAAAGTYDVELIVSNANGSDTLLFPSYITVNVCPLPVADFTASATNICEGDCIDFTDLSVNATGWDWSFPGGSPATSNAQNPTSICYSTAGSYGVQLIASNANGNDTLQIANYITVNVCPPPIADFIASSTNICEGTCIDYTDLSISATGWDWSFPGGIPAASNLQNPLGICYLIAGFYDVQLIVTNANGSDTLLISNYITVNQCPGPSANFVASATNLCEGDCIDFTDLSTGAITWAWSFLGGSPAISIAQFPVNICYNTAGVYDAQLIVTNAFGSDTLLLVGYITVNVCPPPIAGFSASATNLCEGDCIDFTDLSANSPTSWQWSFTGAVPNSSAIQNPLSICYATAGVYDVQLIATNAYGSDTLLLAGYITVNACPPPSASFSASDDSICENDCITFTDQSTNATSWQWTFTGGVPASFIGQNPPAVCYSTSGVYSVQQVVTNMYGTDTLTNNNYITVIACNLPQAGFNASTQFACKGDCITFTDQSTNATSWQWTFPGGNPSSFNGQTPPAVCFSSAGSFDVELIVTNVFGNDTFSITVNIYPDPPAIVVPDSISIEEGTSIQLVASGGTTYQWNPVLGLSDAFVFNPYASPDVTTTYTVTITDVNGCDTTLTVYVEVTPSHTIHFPNVFTPNGDGINDVFQFYYPNGLNAIEIRIFNRWGELIYTSNSKMNFWDGKRKGIDVEVGVYVYYFIATFDDGVETVGEGNVTVVR